MVKNTCTLKDFHHALRARDPLGIGFDSSADSLLHLIWRLLAFDPRERISAAEALAHEYFVAEDHTCSSDLKAGDHNALESLMLDPSLDFNSSDSVSEFGCPRCGRVFDDLLSCESHAKARRHGFICSYDRSKLPTCLNAHVMLPAHASSGYCDIQGRRRTFEDFHSIHLTSEFQYYGT